MDSAFNERGVWGAVMVSISCIAIRSKIFRKLIPLDFMTSPKENSDPLYRFFVETFIYVLASTLFNVKSEITINFHP